MNDVAQTVERFAACQFFFGLPDSGGDTETEAAAVVNLDDKPTQALPKGGMLNSRCVVGFHIKFPFHVIKHPSLREGLGGPISF